MLTATDRENLTFWKKQTSNWRNSSYNWSWALRFFVVADEFRHFRLSTVFRMRWGLVLSRVTLHGARAVCTYSSMYKLEGPHISAVNARLFYETGLLPTWTFFPERILHKEVLYQVSAESSICGAHETMSYGCGPRTQGRKARAVVNAADSNAVETPKLFPEQVTAELLQIAGKSY